MTTSTQLSTVAQANALALANAAEIGTGVLARIAGNEIANTIEGETLTREKLSMLIIAQLADKIKKQTA